MIHVTLQAGDAVQSNKAIQMRDPWPPYVANRDIPFNGKVMEGAIDRYTEGGIQESPPGYGSEFGAWTLSPTQTIVGLGRGLAVTAELAALQFERPAGGPDSKKGQRANRVGRTSCVSQTSPGRARGGGCAPRARHWDATATARPSSTPRSPAGPVGFAVLAIDGSRLMNLHSHLQHAADGLALAAAGELDRKPDSCERAVRALTNLVENEQRFGTAGAAIITMADVDYRFIEALPASDADPIVTDLGKECTAAQAAVARYIEVTVDPQTLTTLMPAAFIGGSDTATTNATAVAGFDAAVCNFTPLFICNPFEKPIIAAVTEKQHIGKQIKFHMVPPGCEDCDVTPGNFGLLESPYSGKLKDIKDMLATKSPGACFLQNNINTKPGISGIGDWLNVRFDLYNADANKLKGKAGFGPARHVRKGFSGDKCALLDGGQSDHQAGAR
jgi:hypothetical protein